VTKQAAAILKAARAILASEGGKARAAQLSATRRRAIARAAGIASGKSKRAAKRAAKRGR
jgi:hypothetical protein